MVKGKEGFGKDPRVGKAFRICKGGEGNWKGFVKGKEGIGKDPRVG